MAVDVEALIKNYERCRDKKRNWEPFVAQILDYICPRKTSRMAGRRSQGIKQTDRQFDSAGEDAGVKLASSMGGTLTSSAQKWFGLVPRATELRNDQSVMEWLEECADRMYAAFNNQPSNFHSEINEVYLDLVYIGTGAILMEEATTTSPGIFGGFRFRALDFSEYCIEEDAFGKVNTLYREFEMTYQAAYDRWGDAIGHDAVLAVAEKPYDMCTFVHAVYPRRSYNRRKMNNQNMPFVSCYVIPRGKVVVAEGGFREFPYAVPRWSKSAGEIYGRGPGHRAYPDVRSQNRLVELELEAGSKAVDPPLLQMHEGIMGDTTLNPAGINYVDPSLAGGNVRNVLAPLESASRFDWSESRIERLEKKIRQAFFNDHLIIPDKPDMTATEFAGRQEIMQRMIGPTMGRLQFELLSIIVDRGFNLMLRASALPPAPPALARYAGADIDITFEGPLARAQRSHDLIAIQRKNDWVIGQVQIGNTNVVDLFDYDTEGRELAQLTGVPANIVRDPRAVAAIRDERARSAKQSAAAAQLGQMAESMGKAAPALKQMPQTAQTMDQALAGGQRG